MTTRTRYEPGTHSPQEWDQIQALRQLILGPVNAQPHWSMDDRRVQILNSLVAQGLAEVTEEPDRVPKYTVRTYTATDKALLIAAEDELQRRPIDDVLADDPNWRAKVQNLMRRMRAAAKAQPQRVFPDEAWTRHQVLIAMQSPLWFSAKDEETGEVVFSSPELTRAYVERFENDNHLKRTA